ncbi:MAG TPA: chorismate-binding protein, partial [Roseovarius sp.]|nr:chorismate-binding protein [Roseovarius sp.]
EFNVAIRTLMLDGSDATLNVGGGVVYDSTAPSEYEEALWKARFASRLGGA